MKKPPLEAAVLKLVIDAAYTVLALMKKLNLVGERFGVCRVVNSAGTSKHGKTLWTCLCDCGKSFTVVGSELRSGHTKSCGCYTHSGTFTTNHGQSRTPLHVLWCNIVQRCTNPKNTSYPDYGGRGIYVCSQWRDSFECFSNDLLLLIGAKPPHPHGYKIYWSIDRIDNTKGYEPGNVRWAHPRMQSQNRRARRWWKRPDQ